jgi:hypothetical protein
MWKFPSIVMVVVVNNLNSDLVGSDHVILFTLQLERQKLYCVKTDEQVSELSLGVNEYLKYLLPLDGTADPVVSSQSPDGISRSSLKLLPLVDQVRSLLRDGTLELGDRTVQCCTADEAH